jgi:thiamine-phosphate pyrophosphorylase
MGYDLYVITDTTIGGGRTHEEIARLAIEGGADVIQLRDKICSARDLILAGRRIRELTRRTGTPFIVNDRLDVALACGADGVHLGQHDLPVASARAIAPSGFVIGVSVGSAQEAVQAEHDGADYIAASPVFSTAQKTDAEAFCGLEGLRRIRGVATVPLIAIGGIGINNVQEVMNAGADGIAVISAVVAQPDIARAARQLKQRILECKQGRHVQHRGVL